MRADGIVRHWNSRLADACHDRSRSGYRTQAGRAHLSGLPVFFMKSFVLYLVFLPLGLAAVAAFNHLPETVHRAMSLFVKFLPLVGVALVVRKLSMKTVDLFLLIGFMIAVMAGYFFHAPGVVVILLSVTGGWLGARYRERRS